MKDHKERDSFILRTNFWKCLVPSQNAFEKYTTKTELFNGKKLYQKVIC